MEHMMALQAALAMEYRNDERDNDTHVAPQTYVEWLFKNATKGNRQPTNPIPGAWE